MRENQYYYDWRKTTVLKDVLFQDDSFRLALNIFDTLERNGITEFKNLDKLQHPADRQLQLSFPYDMGNVEIYLEFFGFKKDNPSIPIYRFIYKLRTITNITYYSAAFEIK